MAGVIVAAALALMGFAFWHGYPGVAALWVGMAAAAWTYPPAQYTGKKDSRGYPTPAHDGERVAMAKYRFWDDLRFRIIVPSGDALPGWPLLYSWFAAVVAASAVYYIPVTDPYTQGYGPLVNAIATFMILTTVNGARRRTATEGDVNPGVRLNTTLAMAAKNPAGTAVLGFGGIILGVGFAIGAEVFRPVWVDLADIPTSALFPILGGAGLLLTLGLKARHEALAKWELIVAARAEWGPRWMMLKMDPAPRLVDRVMVEQATVDTFEAPGSMGAMAFWQMAPKITPTIGAGMEVHTLDVPDQDGQGQPIEGSRHPLRFDVASWPAGSMPNPSDPSVPEDLITLQARVALAVACDEGSLSPRYIFAGIQRLTEGMPDKPKEAASVEGQIVPWTDPNSETEDDEVSADLPPAVWALHWHHPDGASARDFRVRCTGAFAGAIGATAVVDHRAENGNGVLYYGAIGDSRTEFMPGTGVNAESLRHLEGEDLWDSRWASASSKIGPNAPIVQWDTEESAKLADGTTVNRIAFVSRTGVTVEQLFEPESHFPSVLQAAPFVALTGYPGQGRRLGDRHPMAVAAHWSSQPVPDSPDKLAPVPGSQAPEWVLAGRLNEAFKAAKLSRPELAKATCLTEKRSGGHIWKLEVRLYGGNTLADVRTAARRIQGAWSSEWLRVSEAPDGCIIVAGANPRRVKLANPKRDELYLESLNWAQVFLDSGLTGTGGRMPTLTAVGSLPKNKQVQVLDFDIAGTGLDFTSFTGARPKLESNSANSFVDPRRVKNSATVLQILASEVNPMPERAGYDWDHIDISKGIPFATGIEGEPVEYNFKLDPHLLVAGASGGGKAGDEDMRVPVPASKRFPSGWALNKELLVGDEVYAPDGSVTRIVGFSEWETKRGYDVRFVDGQVVTVDPEHLWKVSTAVRRKAWGTDREDQRSARFDELSAQAAHLRELARSIAVGTSATLPDISRMAGMSEFLTYGKDLPIKHLADRVLIPTVKKTRIFKMERVADYLLEKERTIAGQIISTEQANSLRGKWLTIRDFTNLILGRESSRSEHVLARQIISKLSPESKTGNASMIVDVYPVDEVLTLLADRLDRRALCAPNMQRVVDLETIVDTETMAKSFIHRTASRETKNYAVRLSSPLAGPDRELPVAPYALGAWLGDGSSWHTDGITSEDREIIDNVVSGGYPLRRSEGKGDLNKARTYYFDGLRVALRDAGLDSRPNARQPAIKRIPAEYLRASADQRLAVLQGLMDTDGTISKSGSCEIDLCNEDLANDTLELIRSLGIRCSMTTGQAAYTKNGVKKITGTRHRMKFTTDQPVFRLTRKLERLPQKLRLTQQWNYIESIEPTEEEIRMRCIKVDHPEHLFLVEGFIPTHNSVLLQSLIYGAVVKDYELFIADPTKGGADFKFAEPYARGFTTTLFESAAMMKGIYAEVVRRKNENSEHGVGNYRDLPEEIRPKHIIVVIDEFTSLMGADPVPAASDDPEMDDEREETLATNKAKQEIGVYTGKIAREARSAGVTLFLATQKLSAKMLDTIPGAGDLKVNLSRLLLGKATYGDKQSALRAPQDAPDLGLSIPPGRGLFETTAGAAMAIQSWYDQAEQSVLAQKLGDRATPLEESEKLDIAAYMPKGQAGQQQPLPAAPAQELVMDLGEMAIELDEMDLGDFELELDEDDGESPEAGPNPTRVETAELSETAEAVLFLDVDGTLAPFKPTATTLTLDVPMTGAIVYEPAIQQALADTGIPVLWATDREEEASEHLTQLVPSAVGHLTYGGDTHGWWKIDAAEAWLREHPTVKRIAWLDDMLGDEDVVLGVPYSDTARDVFNAAGVELLTIITTPNEGLSVAQVEHAAAWLRGDPLAPLQATEPVSEAVEELVIELPEPVTPPQPKAAAPVDDYFEFDLGPEPTPVPVKARAKRATKPTVTPAEEVLDFELEVVPDSTPLPEPVKPPRPTRPPRPKAAPITPREDAPEFNLGVRARPKTETGFDKPRNAVVAIDGDDLFEAPPKSRPLFEDADLFE